MSDYKKIINYYGVNAQLKKLTEEVYEFEEAVLEKHDKEHITEEIADILVILQQFKEKYKYLYQKALDNTVSADRENINLKKQIKEMAKYIAKEDVSETFCDYKTVCDQNCEECVEAYFRESEEE